MRIHRFAYCTVLAALAACGSVDRPFTDGGGDDTPIDAAAAPDALPQFTVSVSRTGNGGGRVVSNPDGVDCGSTCSADFDAGQSVTLSVIADADSTFVGWTGGGCSGTGTCTFDVDADISVQAAFALNNSVVVTLGGNGTGTVISDVSGIDCPGDCDEAYGPGQTVVLTATATGDSFFEGWNGGGCSGTGTCTVTTDTAVGVTATFTLNQYTLTVNAGGNGAGAITSNPSGISCPGTCLFAFDSGTDVVLTATPSAGRFAGWSNGPCAGTSTCSIDMTADVSVDATFQLIQVTNVTSSTADGAYTAPSSILVQVTFTDPVVVTGTPTLALNTGVSASFAGGSGTNTLTFSYTIAAGHQSSDLDYTATTSLALAGGTIKDSVGNNATLTLPAPGAVGSLGANKNIVVDAVAPTVNGLTSSTANGAYTSGSVIAVQVVFSEAVNVTGTPQLAINTGTTVNYSSGSGTNTLTFNYTVAAGQNSVDLDETATTSLTLNGGTIRDAATNNSALTLPAPGAVGSLGANKNIVVDTLAPTVSNVNSSTANGAYNAGQVISIQVNFGEAVSVTGTPQLTLNTGATVNYASGSGTSALTFSYTIAAGQNSADLDYSATTSLALNGGTIRDVATNNATLTLPAVGGAQSLGGQENIVVDTTAPTVTNVTSSTANGAYTAGGVVSIQVTFSELVNVTGTPQLALNSGATVNYASGTGTATLTFTYTIAAGQNAADLDYSATTSLTLNGGTIRDAATNGATLTLPTVGGAQSLGGQKNIVVDTATPTVSSLNSTTVNSTYGVGANPISIQVVFSEPVTVTGTPRLTVNSGATVNYTSGSGTATLNFDYTIAAGQASADLDETATSSLGLNGGTIRDAATNNATLTLPAPGAAGSLGANKAIVIVQGITLWTQGTTTWPDDACNPTNSFGSCNTNAQNQADAWASYACQRNDYANGVWTTLKQAGCAGGTGTQSFYCSVGGIPCVPVYETNCQPSDQTVVNFTCYGSVFRYGYPNQFPYGGSFGQDFLLGEQINVPTASTLLKFGIRVAAGGPAVKVGLYSDSGGNPGTLLAQVSGTMAAGTLELDAASQIALPAGNYWLMAVYSVNASPYQETPPGTANTIKYISHPFANALPTTFPASHSTYTGAHFNYYVVVK